MIVDGCEMAHYPDLPSLIAGLRSGEDEALRVVRINFKADDEMPDSDIRALVEPRDVRESTGHVPLTQVFSGVRARKPVQTMSYTERMNRIADLLEAAGKRSGLT